AALRGAPLAADHDDVAGAGLLALDERAYRGELVAARAADRADRHRRARADADAAAHAAVRIHARDHARTAVGAGDHRDRVERAVQHALLAARARALVDHRLRRPRLRARAGPQRHEHRC